jgi:phage tail protein X
MDVPYQTVIVRGEGVTLERMLARRDRAYTPGLAELAFTINPGLAALGPVVPPGTAVKLPLASALPAAQATVVRLWD